MLVRNSTVGRTRLRCAWAVAALGVAANVLVVSVNGGAMPRTIPIAADAADSVDHLSNVFAVETDVPLLWLGDVIAEPDWLPRTNVVSIGDLLLSTGIAGWVFLAALDGKQKRRPLAGRGRGPRGEPAARPSDEVYIGFTAMGCLLVLWAASMSPSQVEWSWWGVALLLAGTILSELSVVPLPKAGAVSISAMLHIVAALLLPPFLACALAVEQFPSMLHEQARPAALFSTPVVPL